jgi:hypothetical protein
MVGTIITSSQVGEFDARQFQQILKQFFLFFCLIPFVNYFVPYIRHKHGTLTSYIYVEFPNIMVKALQNVDSKISHTCVNIFISPTYSHMVT